MKIIVCITVIAFIISGCTTLRPVDLTPPSLQDSITQGDLIKPGNRVRITTIDEKTYKFKILSVSDGYVKGKDIEIPINDVALVEKGQFSILKTTLLVGGIIYSLYVIGEILAAPAAIMSGG